MRKIKKSNFKSDPSLPYLSKGKNLPVITSILSIIVMILIIVIVSIIYITKLQCILDSEMNSYIKEVNTESITSINKQVNLRLELLEAIAISIGEDSPININKALSTLNKESKHRNFKRMGVILPNGKSYTSDGYTQDFSDRISFQKALSGISNVSDILTDKVDGEKIIVYTTPIYSGKNIVGVVFATHSIDLYKDTISVSTFDGSGASYILKSDTTLITNSSISYINTKEDGTIDINKDSSDKNNKDFNTMTSNMKEGKSGTLEYNLSGTDVFMIYAPIGINDWYLLSTVPSEILTEKSNSLSVTTFHVSIFIVILFAVLMLHIIAVQTKSKKALSKLAYVDPLTGSRNATKFYIDSNIILKTFKENYALVRFDIDKFKYINDVFGYDEGNKVLKSIGNILEKNTNPNEIYSRIQCDNFALLIKYNDDNDITERLEHLNNEFLKTLNSKTKYNLVINFGVYKITDTKVSFNTINDMASTSLSSVKGGHKSAISFYDNELLDNLLNECKIENIMHSSLENKDFKIYLQGKYTLDPARLCGAEALIRWIHPEKGFLSPGEFIPIFEKNGFIVNIDKFVFEEVCRLIRSWINRGITPVTISVNQTKESLFTTDFIENLKNVINKYNIPPNLIEIEITESAFFDNIDLLLEITKKLKDIGFTLAMDDFGSGYSSLNLLKDIPVDVLKLDKVFFNETSNTKRGQIVISSIVSMAKSLNIKVISEGVETNEQSDFLKSIDCNMVQGYLYSKPVTIKDFENKLQQIN